MSDDKDTEIQELRERLARLEGIQPAAAPVPPPASAKPKSGCANGIVALMVLVALLVIVGTCTGNSSLSSGGAGSSSTAPSWSPPVGFQKMETRNGAAIGVQWEKPTRAECRSGRTCFAINVVSERACPRSLYMSISLFDAANRNIGWTNDTAQGVHAGDPVRMVFSTYEEGVETAEVAEASCY